MEKLKFRLVTLLLFLYLTPVYCQDLTLDLIDKPLVFCSIPEQQAHINSTFMFNPWSFINIRQPEVNYRVSMNGNYLEPIPVLLDNIPNGFTQIDDGEDACPNSINLRSGEHCILRFKVDKKNYVYSQGKSEGPVLSYSIIVVRATHTQNFHAIVNDLPDPTQISVTPTSQDGLKYDPATQSIIGTPTRSGVYRFTISANNGKFPAESQDLKINVGLNPHDKPVFKRNYKRVTVQPEQDYHLNLMELIEPMPGMGSTNQIHFKIDSNASWPRLNKENPAILEGQPPLSAAGEINEMTIIATSNTGGDSLPMTLDFFIMN